MSAYVEIAERFASDTGPHTREKLLPYGHLGPGQLVTDRPHEMTVLLDQGPYRHLRFASPDRSAYWFDLVTWRGVLAFRGDVGDGYVFARDPDMFAFFRGRGINPHYWSEKLDGGRGPVKQYSEDLFKQIVVEHLAEFAEYDPMLARTAKAEILADPDTYYEAGARSLLSEWEQRGVFSDVWEWDLRDFDPSFLWACYAIVWGIAQYDRARQNTPAPVETVSAGA